MKKKKNYAKTLSFAITEEQMLKVTKIAAVMGKNVSSVVRLLIDSAAPDIDPNDPFWRRAGASGIFDMMLPRDAIVPFIANWFNLPLTDLRKIDNFDIIPCPDRGIAPTLWALERIRKTFYEKGVCNRDDKQDECEG